MSQIKKVTPHTPRNAPAFSVITLSILAINSLLVSSMVNAEVAGLDTMVVTGEKIDKNIKETTTAVTLFSGDVLKTGEITEVKDIAIGAPNVIPDTFGHISIRGVSGGGAATGGVALMTGARARIATVVDGTTQDWSGYNFTPTNLWDVEQVEVLRGPQSTTQGASAIAGALVVNTNDPTFESEAAVRLGLESYKNGNLKHNLAFMSSGALVENELAYRIAADQTKGDGWLNYDTSSYSGNLPNLSDSSSLNIRGKLLFEPTVIPELSAKLTVNYLENEGEHANFASNTPQGIASQEMTISDSGGAVARVQDSKNTSIAADINYELSDGITNSLHISRIDSDIYADGYGFASGTTTHTYDIEQTTTSLENRIIFNDKRAKLVGVAGLFYAYKDSIINASQGVININTSYTTTTKALYGEGTYSLSSDTKVTTGLRIENEETDKTGSFFSTKKVNQNTSSTHYLPKLAVTHDISSTTTLGASVSKGYSPNGTYINTIGDVFSFDSEEVTSFELSSKSDFGAGTTIRANLFYNNYKDYQALSGFTIVNVDAAHTIGFELEANTWLTDSLEIQGSVGLLRSEIDKYNSLSNYKGNQLSGAPETNFGFGFTHYIENNLSFGADVTYVGEYYSNLSNTNNNMAGDYFIANTRLQYVIGDLTFNGFVKNLTGEKLLYYRTDSLAAVGQDRTVGISLTYRM